MVDHLLVSVFRSFRQHIFHIDEVSAHGFDSCLGLVVFDGMKDLLMFVNQVLKGALFEK